MLDLSKVTFPLSLVIGDVKLILIGARPTIEYVNGKRTDTIIGTTYTVVQNGGTYEKFNVKVPDIENAIEPDYIANSKTPIFVEFENAVCKIYTDTNGRVQVSVKADAINIAN
jgi:hypothetical protein